MKRRRTRPTRIRAVAQDEEPVVTADAAISTEEEAIMRKAAHECPVPKPRGIIGKALGFGGSQMEQVQPGKRKDPPRIEIRRQD